jgi:lipopolysaccharide/colanic/teichoic acid biosynthesis glycosyltransferase
VALDGAMLFLALALATFGAEAAGASAPAFWLVAFPLLVTAIMALLGAYGAPFKARLAEDAARIVASTSGAATSLLVLEAVASGSVPALEISRPWLFATVYLVAGRAALSWSGIHAADVRARGRFGTLVDRAVKRTLDLLAAGVLLVLLAPVLALIAAAVRLDTPGPVFYRCRRVGYRGAPLDMLKFRKMREDVPGLPLTLRQDDRFTRVGRVLARTKLDELPQLWHVLRGEMSLVGPRPEDEWFVELHREAYKEILAVRPGVTGLCQLAFAEEGAILDPADRIRDYTERLLPQKTRLDRLYAKRRSIWMDFRIMGWTAVAVVLDRDVAVHRETARLTVRASREERSPEAVTAQL